MTRRFRNHKLLALLVLVGTGLWVLSGDFAQIGSHRPAAEAAAPPGPATPEAAPGAARPAAPEAPAGVSAGGPAEAPAEAPARTVLVAEPEVIDFPRTIRVSGITEADKTSVLAARSSGVIRELHVTDGDRVEAGAVLLSIDGPAKVAAVATGEALVAQRRAQSKAADALAASGEGAKIAADIARADLAAAEAQLTAAAADVADLQVVAPFAGIVDHVEVEAGSWLQLGAEVATLLALDPLVVRGEVSERDRAQIRLGGPAQVTLGDGQIVAGQVRNLRAQASAGTRTFGFEVAVPNPDLTWPAGSTTMIALPVDTVPVMVVPRSVITLGEDGRMGLRVVEPGDVAGFRPVTIVDDTGKGLAVAGVPAGTRVIVAGQDMVANGDRVRVVVQGAAAGPAAPGAQP